MVQRETQSRHANRTHSSGNPHGNQCPCAVCVDFSGSLTGSVVSPAKDAAGGSLAGDSYRRQGDDRHRESRALARTTSATRPTPSSECLTSPRQDGADVVSLSRTAHDPSTYDPSSSATVTRTGRDDTRGAGPGRGLGRGAGGVTSTDSSASQRPSTPKDKRSRKTGEGGTGIEGVPGAQGSEGALGAQGGGGRGGKRSPSGTRPSTRGSGRRDAAKDYGDGTGKSLRPRALGIQDGYRADKYLVLEDECDQDKKEPDLQLPICPLQQQKQEQACDKQVAEFQPHEMVPYLPQSKDDIAPANVPMGPLGPWAVGKPDWTPLGGLTGTRPIVDRYTITRYSIPEWRQRNLKTFERAAGDSHTANLVNFNARACIDQTLSAAPKNQKAVTVRLQQRNADVRRLQPEIERTHKALWSEIQRLSCEDDRIRRLLCAIEKISRIAGESIQLRTTRMEPDLTRDEVNDELCKEVGLVNEIRQLLQRTLDQVRQQLDVSRAAKHRLEQDMADKETAVRIDSANIQLTMDSPIIMFHEGSARFMDNQSTPESWEIASRENMCLSENERSKSCTLRAVIEAVITDSSRDLLTQKCRVDDALVRHIELISALLQDLEDQLARILRNIVDTESLIRDVKDSIRKLDFPLKKAQTRLHTRSERPRIENTRDCPQYGLIDEIKSISEQTTALMAQLCPAESALQKLFGTRRHLESEIQSKKKNLFIDRDRVQKLRLQYPLAESLMARAFSQCDPCR